MAAGILPALFILQRKDEPLLVVPMKLLAEGQRHLSVGTNGVNPVSASHPPIAPAVSASPIGGEARPAGPSETGRDLILINATSRSDPKPRFPTLLGELRLQDALFQASRSPVKRIRVIDSRLPACDCR